MRGDKFYNAEIVYNQFNCWPNQIPLWLAIAGDRSDNIIGVPQVGEKRIKQLFTNFGTSLKEFILSNEEPPNCSDLLKRVREYRKEIELNLKLIELKSGKISPDENIINKDINQEKVIKMINAHGLQSLLVPILEWMNGHKH
jgi:5'-3' exonuclease